MWLIFVFFEVNINFEGNFYAPLPIITCAYCNSYLTGNRSESIKKQQTFEALLSSLAGPFYSLPVAFSRDQILDVIFSLRNEDNINESLLFL